MVPACIADRANGQETGVELLQFSDGGIKIKLTNVTDNVAQRPLLVRHDRRP
jgi:hypothetical protein